MSPVSRFFTIMALLCLAFGVYAQDQESLTSAITFGETERVTEILKTDPAQARVLDDEGRTLLHEIAHERWSWKAQERLTIAGLLIDSGVAVNTRAYDGSTPLHEAAERGTAEMIALLLKKGADVNLRNDAGKTPLCVAVEGMGSEQTPLVKALLDGNANLNLADDNGMTPLHLAVRRGDIAMVKLLLSKGAKTGVRNNDGETPLHLAQDVAIAKVLLDAGADMNVEDERWRTPLFAAAGQSIEMLTLFLQRGANLRAVNRFGATLLHAAVSSHSDPTRDRARIKFLMDKGLSINVKDAAGCTPLYDAVFGDAVLAAFFGKAPSSSEWANTTNLLLSLGANPNVANRRGWTPLHMAAFANQEGLVKALLAKKANVNARTADGMTPLALACRKGFVGKEEMAGLGAMMIPDEIMAQFTESDLQKTRDELSVLFGSVANANVVGLLVKAGTDLRTKDAAGRTPLGVALQSGFTEAQKVLLKAGAPAEKAPAVVLKRPDKSAMTFRPDIMLGDTRLHRAAAKGDAEAVRQLLAKGAAVNARNSAGQTPLFLACAADKAAPEIIDLLLQHGADVSADDTGYTPLHKAAQTGRLDAVTALSKKGDAINARDINGQTPLHLAATAEVAAALVKGGAKLEDRDECGRTPLATAVMAGNKAVVEALLGLGADLHATDEKGGTLFHAAALSQSEGLGEVIPLLLARGLDINAKDVFGRTPLNLAALWGRPRAVAGLLAGKADVNAGDKNGRTPLHLALVLNLQLRDDTDLIGNAKEQQPKDEDRMAVVTHLLEGGAAINGGDAAGVMPLVVAVMTGNLKAATLLLDRGAKVNGADNAGNTPLHFAAECRNIQLMDLLLARGAQLNARSNTGQTPLHVAAGYGVMVEHMAFRYGGKTDAVMARLVEKGADVNAKDSKGNTPLHYAVESSYHEGQLNTVKCLLQHKAEVNAKNKDGKTPLIAALGGWVSKDTVTVINLLLAQGANPNLADTQGRTPLIIASGNPGEGSPLCVKALLAKKAGVSAKGPQGNTALHMAVESGNVAVVKLLVAAGANPNQKNAQGQTPRQLAKEKKNAALIAALAPPKKK